MSTMVPPVPVVAGSIMTYSGSLFEVFDFSSNPPNIVDVSVGLGRICRFGGQGLRWWPVLLHSMVVGDLLPKEAEVYGLLHDAAEAIMGDVPRGFKTPDYKALEVQVLGRIFSGLGLDPMNHATESMVKAADDEALYAESWIIGPPNLGALLDKHHYHMTEDLIRQYLERYPLEECIRPDGTAVLEFRRRVEVALSLSLIGEPGETHRPFRSPDALPGRPIRLGQDEHLRGPEHPRCISRSDHLVRSLA